MWDVTNGQALQTLPPHKNEVYAVAGTADGSKLASASRSGMIHVLGNPQRAAGGGN